MFPLAGKLSAARSCELFLQEAPFPNPWFHQATACHDTISVDPNIAFGHFSLHQNSERVPLAVLSLCHIVSQRHNSSRKLQEPFQFHTMIVFCRLIETRVYLIHRHQKKKTPTSK